MSELASYEAAASVGRLVLNRPAQRNALSIELLEALHDRLEVIEADQPRVLVLAGAGRAFCAGMDLKQVTDAGDTPLHLLRSLGRLTLRLRRLESVVVAEVNRAAIGGGCGLACAADLAVTHADAKLGFPEVDLGLCPAVVAPWVVRKIGAGPARRMLLEGGTMSGSRAHERGLIDHLAEAGEGLEELTRGLVERIAGGGARALAATKGLLNELDGSPDEDAIMRGAALSAEVLQTPEAQAALRARLDA